MVGNAILSSVFLAFLGGLGGNGAFSPMIVDAELQLYRPWNRACGATCTYLALTEVGRNVSLISVLKHLQIREGTSLRSIYDYLRLHHVECKPVRAVDVSHVTDVLVPGRRCAILHVDRGTHFLFAKRTHNGRILVVDGRNTICSDVMRKLGARFSGTALVIGDGAGAVLEPQQSWVRFAAFAFAYALGCISGSLMASERREETPLARREEA